MANRQQQRAAGFIKQFRVKPGSKVSLAEDFDPHFPVVTPERRQSLLEIKETLEAQAPKGAAPAPFQPVS